MSNDTSFCPSSPASATGTAVAGQQRDAVNDTKPAHVAPAPSLSLARVCGPSRSKCGYCGGKRMNVLELDDGHNIVLQIPKDNNGASTNNGSLQNVKSIDKIDATKTSKSYGLLFDSLPYDTYEDLINHGWRRSGKHLYRPHNFESCCPALSIRLESSKFASRSTPQKSKLEDDVANSVLVGGSKSQRRVGRNLLRSLNVYNSKCLPAEDDSVNASNMANIKLDGSKVAKPTIDSGLDHHHLKKKSRRFSPGREVDKTVSVSTALKRTEFERASLQEFENTEHKFLLAMANVIYKELTKQAIATVNAQALNNDAKLDKPKWAWWNNIESDEIPKWCSFKLVPHGAFIKASTVACAAASGRSRGVLDKLELAWAVIDQLKESANTYLHSNKSSEIRRVTEVAVHEKSGHVHIILDIGGNIPAKAPIKLGISTQRLQNAADEKADPIQEMISRYGKVELQYNPDAKVPLTDKCVPRFLTVRSTPVYESSLQPEVHRLFCLYQSTTHGDFNPFADHDESSNFRDEVHEYNYYKQKNLPGFLDIDVAYRHLDGDRRDRIKTSYVIFYKFLCETPVPTATAESNPFCLSNEDGYDIGIPFGTYHQQYRLSTSKDAFDGPLVAVGVLDILPHCTSSVYAFYDPIFSARLELGKYTALREIEWVRRASKYRTELKYYYLGESKVCMLLFLAKIPRFS